jgi:hypothetical protein
MCAVAAGSWGCLGRPASECVADYVAVTGGAAAPRGLFMLPSLRPAVRSPTSEVVGRATITCFIR